MTHWPPRCCRRLPRWIAVGVLLVLAAGCASTNTVLPKSTDTDLEFAGQMALRGSWHEAIYRWERVIAKGDDSARVRNNLAVAYERLGEFDRAAEEYEKALAMSRNVRQIEENYRQFLRFYRDYKEQEIVDEPFLDEGPGDED